MNLTKRKTMYKVSAESGFTLIELLVSTVIALVVLGGLLVSFQSQYSEYKYQNKRVDAAQDVEFTLSFIADDLRGALHSTAGTFDPVETNAFSGAAATGTLTFWVWDSANPGADAATQSVQRKYSYAGLKLGYDRAVATHDTAGTVTALADKSSVNDMLQNVTFFKIFKDGTTPRGGFTGIPNGLPAWNVNDAAVGTVSIPAYTILIEVAVDAGYKKGSFFDVKGVDVQTTTDKRKRMWRYVQVYPRTAL